MTVAGQGQALLTARDVVASYGSHKVLHGVSADLFPGELVGLVGPNGSGKSTLLHCLTGYHAVSGGEVTLGGKNLASLNRRTVATQVAFVPQHTDSVYSYSAVEMVLMGRHPFSGFAAVDSPADVEAAMTALDELEISHLAHRKYGQLSGGEQQLVLLARAFAQHTPVLILDEPLTGLDLRHQYQLMDALSRAAAGAGHRAVLATFHDLAIAARWCTRIILLCNGRIIAAGPASQVITPQNLAAAYGIHANVIADASGEMTIQVTGYTSSVDS